MAAAPKNGILTFRGASGKTYTYNVYISDVNGAFLKWSTVKSAASTDTDFITAPENMQLIDASVPTGLTDTTSATLWLADGPVPNALVAWAPIVNTLPSRSFPPVKIAGGRKVQFLQNT